MTRLIDDLDPNDPEQAHAAALLRAGGPLPESEVSRQRVLRALDRQRSRVWGGRLSPALAAAVLLALAGTAGAAFGIARWVSPSEEGAGESAPVRASQADAVKSDGARITDPSDSRPDVGDPSTQSSAKASANSPSDAVHPHSSGKKEETALSEAASLPKGVGLPKTASSPKAGAKDGEQTANEARLLHQVVGALRSSKDPKKAAKLLREYEQAEPSGALEEEVLALKIETALSNHDPKAQELARRYLARYPDGRFRSVAAKAVSQGK